MIADDTGANCWFTNIDKQLKISKGKLFNLLHLSCTVILKCNFFYVTPLTDNIVSEVSTSMSLMKNNIHFEKKDKHFAH